MLIRHMPRILSLHIMGRITTSIPQARHLKVIIDIHTIIYIYIINIIYLIICGLVIDFFEILWKLRKD
jgi:hypothetical protein